MIQNKLMTFFTLPRSSFASEGSAQRNLRGSKKYGLVLAVLFFIVFVIFPTGAWAVDEKPSAPITSVTGIVNLTGTILTWMARVFWIAAIMAVFYAGFLYLGSSADPERVKKAKKQLLYAVVAMAIGLMAWGLPALVENFLSGGNSRGGGGGTPPGDYNLPGDING